MAGRQLLRHVVGDGALLVLALFAGADLLQKRGVTTLGRALEVSRQ